MQLKVMQKDIALAAKDLAGKDLEREGLRCIFSELSTSAKGYQVQASPESSAFGAAGAAL